MTMKNLKNSSLTSLDQESHVTISNIKPDIKGYVHVIKLSFTFNPWKRFYLEALHKFNICLIFCILFSYNIYYKVKTCNKIFTNPQTFLIFAVPCKYYHFQYVPWSSKGLETLVEKKLLYRRRNIVENQIGRTTTGARNSVVLTVSTGVDLDLKRRLHENGFQSNPQCKLWPKREAINVLGVWLTTCQNDIDRDSNFRA